eukprot:COSAG06_NODE_3820_length_4874_cov_7.460524_6_plen_139_part_00
MQSRDNDPPPLTGFGTWTANDYSNFVTICVVAVGSTLLVVFKSCCVKISLCFGLWSCDREVQDGSEYKPPRLRIQTAPAAQGTRSSGYSAPRTELCHVQPFQSWLVALGPGYRPPYWGTGPGNARKPRGWRLGLVCNG